MKNQEPSTAIAGSGPDRDARPSASAALALAIRRARTGRFTLTQLAERAGISAGLLSVIERGRGNPSLLTLARLGEALDLSLVELMRAIEATESVGSASAPLDAVPADAAPVSGPTASVPVDVPAPTTPTDRLPQLSPSIGASGEVIGHPGEASDSDWTSSMTLRSGQEARVLVHDGALELTFRDRTAAVVGPGAIRPLSVDLSLRTVVGPAPMELPQADDPRWLDVVRGTTPFQPTTLACQMLFTHVARCVRQDPSSPNVKRWVGELRGFFVKYEPLSPGELARIFN